MTEKNEKVTTAMKRALDEATYPYVEPRTGVDLSRVRNLCGLPKTLATAFVDKESKESQRLAQDDGASVFHSSLTQHAMDLGQFPMTSFVGYGVLQQIAQNGMIRTCIQTVADDMSRQWIQVTGGDNSDPKRLQEIQDCIDKKYGLQGLFNKVFSTVGYMGGCFLFIDTNQPEETKNLSLPLAINDKSAEIQKGSEVSFVLIDPINVSPAMYNAFDPLKEDYMKPDSWFVMGKKVHSSRLMRFVDNEPPLLLRPAYNFLGIPQAQILWDYVLHWNKAREEGVGILEKLNFMVYKTNLGEAIEAGGLSMLDQKVTLVNRYRSNKSLVVCDNEEDFQNITLTIGGVTDIIRQQFEFIACLNRTPAVKLLGISPSGFNATGQSDIRNYYDHIRAKQELYRNQITKIIQIIQIQLFGEIDPSIDFVFNELNQDDEDSMAMTAKTKIDGASVLQDRNVISAEEVREYVRKDPTMGFDFLSEELPEPMDGQLETDDPSMMNNSMMEFLKAREQQSVPQNTPQKEEKVKEIDDVDKAGAVY